MEVRSGQEGEEITRTKTKRGREDIQRVWRKNKRPRGKKEERNVKEKGRQTEEPK